jgi:hypothetical protein
MSRTVKLASSSRETPMSLIDGTVFSFSYQDAAGSGCPHAQFPNEFEIP